MGKNQLPWGYESDFMDKSFLKHCMSGLSNEKGSYREIGNVGDGIAFLAKLLRSSRQAPEEQG
jgi:hypothetical protein